MIDLEVKVQTEAERDIMHEKINQYGLSSKEALKASKELDIEVLKGIMALNPEVKILYMDKLLKQKDEEIRRLQNKIAEMKSQPARDKAEVISMYVEAGFPLKEAILTVKERMLWCWNFQYSVKEL